VSPFHTIVVHGMHRASSKRFARDRALGVDLLMTREAIFSAGPTL